MILQLFTAFTGIFFSFFLYFGYTVITEMGYVDKLQPNPEKNNCSYHDFNMEGGPEDLTKISEYIAVTGSDQRKLLWEDQGGPKQVPNGKLFAINLRENAIHPIKIEGLPSQRKFHPHGIYYNKKTELLSVINHGYDDIATRIEVFKINQSNEKQIKAKHVKSLVFATEFNGIVNDLIEVSEKEYLVTRYMHYADPLTGRKTQPINLKVWSMFQFLLQLKKTEVMSCQHQNNSDQKMQKIECVPINNTQGRMTNGITWNKKDQVLVADTQNKSINVYKIELNFPRENRLQFQEQIKVTRNPDNVEYDEYYNQYMVGGLGKIFEHMRYVSEPVFKRDYWGFADIIQRKENQQYQVENIYIRPDGILGCSSAITYQNKLYLGSWTDKTLVVCKMD